MSGQLFIVDTSEFDAATAAALKACRDLRPAFRELRKPFRQDQKEHAKDAKGPDGPWAPLARATLERRAADARAKRRAGGGLAGKARRARRRRRVLKQRKVLGRLPFLLDVQVTRDSLIGMSKVLWGDAHFSGKTVGKGVKLPSREFLYVSDELARKVVDVLGRHVTEPMR